MENMNAPTLSERPPGGVVASYRDLAGATLATAQFVEAGYEAGSITVVPASVEPLRAAVPVRDARRDGERLASGCAFIGALVAGAIWWLRGGGADDLVLGVAIGLASAVAVAGAVRIRELVASRRASRIRRLVRAQRFDIVVTGANVGGASHVLAQWWDPAAPTAGSLIAA